MKSIFKLTTPRRQLLNLCLIGLFAILVIPQTGCGQRLSVVKNDDLEKNMRLWRKSNVTDYNFVIYQMTMGTRSWVPKLIKVRNGMVISKEPFLEPGPMTLISDFDDFETIEKAYSTIQNAYDNGYKVDVGYNSELGYPERIAIDPAASLTDGTIITDITQFNVVDDV